MPPPHVKDSDWKISTAEMILTVENPEIVLTTAVFE